MKELVCIVCPNSCKLKIDDNLNVTGAMCKRGDKFAIDEMTAPKRSISSSVGTVFSDIPVVPVRTDGEIPKELIFDLMDVLYKTVIDKKLKRGSVVIENVLGTGVNIITTTDMIFEY